MQGIIQAIQQAVQRGIQHFLARSASQEYSAYSLYKDELRAKPLKVFISYDWDDRENVYALYDRLTGQEGIEPKLDKKNVTVGIADKDVAAWKAKLMDAMKEADCVIICVSKESNRNRGVFKRTEVPTILKASREEHDVTAYVLLVKLEECPVQRRYKGWPVAEIYTEEGYDNFLNEMVKNAYKEYKVKRGLTYKSPFLDKFK
jgi:hypothetical protein